LEKVNHDIDGKLDRTELDALRDYMDKQLKKLKKLAVSKLLDFFSPSDCCRINPMFCLCTNHFGVKGYVEMFTCLFTCLFFKFLIVVCVCFMFFHNEERAANPTTCTSYVGR
jgi:hypothetical protein